MSCWQRSSALAGRGKEEGLQGTPGAASREGGELGEHGSVVGGVDAEAEVQGEEELDLKGVELGEREAAYLGPVRRGVSSRTEHSGKQ